MFKFGDIVHVDHFPYSDEDKFKNRYAVIVSDGEIMDGDYLLCQVTTKFKNDEFSFELNKETIIKPLKKPSEVRAQKLWTGNKKLFSKFAYGSLTTKGQIKLKDLINSLFSHL